jgi:hypothetical protein
MKTWAIMAGAGALASGLFGGDAYRAEITVGPDGTALVQFAGAPRLASGENAAPALIAAEATGADAVWSVSLGGGDAAWTAQVALSDAPTEVLPGVWLQAVGDAAAQRYELRIDAPDAARDTADFAALSTRLGEVCVDLALATDIRRPMGVRDVAGGVCIDTGPMNGPRLVTLTAETAA